MESMASLFAMPWRSWPFVLVFGLPLFPLADIRAEDRRETTVGMKARIDQLVLPGPELEVKPLGNPRLPMVVRIASVFPHGTAHRYDIEYYGLEPGTFDLREYLLRKDGSEVGDLPPIRVAIKTVLPAGQILPHELGTRSSPWLGGYRLLLIVAAIIWVIGLLAILLVGRRKKQDVDAGAKPQTVADRLRPLVESGLAGTLSLAQRAELERTLLAFWRRRLRLEEVRPAEAMAKMRDHAEARQLLEQLEIWLHRPGPQVGVDINALLRPYQNVPDQGWEAKQTLSRSAS